jgi:hypothetical protein
MEGRIGTAVVQKRVEGGRRVRLYCPFLLLFYITTIMPFHVDATLHKCPRV